MKHIPVQSSQIASCAHEPRTSLLEVKFHSGGSTYQYGNVSESQFAEMMGAPSVGSWFSKNIKGNKAHPYSKVDQPSVD